MVDLSSMHEALSSVPSTEKKKKRKKTRKKHVVAHAYNSALGRWRKENQEFNANACYLAST